MTLLTPSNFKNNWYGWVTNQWAHALLGQCLFGVIMLATFTTGEFASRTTVWCAMAVAYIGWEIATHAGGKWWDAIEDFVFVCCYGAGWVAAVFKEIEPGRSIVSGDANSVLPIIGLFAFHSALGVLLRVEKRAKG